jgi:arylsulfatase A-like enzyme
MYRAHKFPRFVTALAFFGGAFSLHAVESPLPASPKAAHVVLVVWDGMRPNFINAENTPNAFALAQRGTFFANNHSFWPTTTEVNGTVLATGTFPARSTIVANREYRPDIDPRGPVATDALATIQKGDKLTGGHYIETSTIAEIVRKAGFPTAVAGTKPVALLHDRSPERPETPKSAIVFAGNAFPAAILGPITEALGPFIPYKPDPANPTPNTAANRWTTRALLEHLWRDGVPRYSVLWLSDPDFPQHVTAPGHPAAMEGIHDSDTNLGLLVEELKKRGELDKTDIFLVSDHGFSTIERSVEPVKYFTEHGVPVSNHFSSPPQPGQVMSVSVGGATGLYVIGHEKTTIAKLVDLLQASDFAGPIFTRDALPGTFPLHRAHIDSPYAADIVFSFRWSDGVNAYGIPGLIFAEARAGAGMHGSIGKFDIHNTLLAGGPDIRVGYRDENPTGNIDVGATVLHLLGIAHPDGADGRVLTEALANAPMPEEKPVTERVEATRTLADGTVWKQYLQVSSFGGKSYFDEGNAEGKK